MVSDRRAFTLVELLFVVVIAAILLALSIGTLSSVLRGKSITQAAQIVVDTVNLARETAATRNNVIEVVFKKDAREGAGEKFFQSISGRIVANDGTKTDLIRRQWLPEGAVISTAPGLSSILENATDEAVFRIRPSGELEAMTGTNGNWFVTVVAARDEGKGVAALRNFATIQINPLTARTSIYRP